MKIGFITQPNQKGQIVIPKSVRDQLAITVDSFLQIVVRGNGIILSPIDSIVTKADFESSYFDILQKTQGAWRKDNWPATQSKRAPIEKAASEKRKKSW